MSRPVRAAKDATTVPNKLCRRCLRTCRQSDQVLLLECPRFQPRPFKVQEPPKEQLDLFR